MPRKSIKRTILVLILLGMAFGNAGCPLFLVYVSIPDPALDAAVREALGIHFGFLTTPQMLKLRNLDARGLGVRDLAGLEYCANLTWLDLDTNDVSDLTPLSDLINLTTLNLDSNQIFDLAPLAGLLNLDSLSLFDNQIDDIQALVSNAANGGLGPGDHVILDGKTLSDYALTVQLPELEAFGVVVSLVEPASTGNV